MKAKKIILTTAALLGAGSLALGARKVVKEQQLAKKREEIIHLVRSFFASQGQIATVYVQLYESSEDTHAYDFFAFLFSPSSIPQSF